jgi:hypothetical protein
VLLLPAYGTPLGVVTLSLDSTTAVGFTSTKAPPPGATTIVFSVEGGDARYRDDGTAPTSSEGVYLPSTDTNPIAPYTLSGRDILIAIQFIAVSTSATIWAAFYKV